jgi:hypothetical protein
MTFDENKTVGSTLDSLIHEINSNFLTLLYAITLYQTGLYNIDQFSDDASISPKVGRNVHIEPIPISELKRFKPRLPNFFIEAFHARLVRLWNQCLIDLYEALVEFHFAGVRQFSTLKKQRVDFDFSSADTLEGQMKEELLRQFGFKELNERQSIINRELNPRKKGQDALKNIFKNVQVRNAIEHKKALVHPSLLKKLSCSQIEVLDDQGNTKYCGDGDLLSLSVPEISSFMSSIFVIQQIWRGEN